MLSLLLRGLVSDITTAQQLLDTNTRCAFKFTDMSDGSGENDVIKVAGSGLKGMTSGAMLEAITKVQFCVPIGRVEIAWAGATPATALVLSGTGHFNFDGESPGISAPIKNNAETPSGDLIFSTDDFTGASSYTVVVECRKRGYIF